MLSAQLGISRGPIREALRALELEGRLVARPNYGTYVATFTLEDVIESITVRELIEPYAVERALERDGAALLTHLHAAMAAMRKAAREDERKALVAKHDDFHALFYAHAGNRLLSSVWERVRLPLRSHVRLQEVGYEGPGDIPRAHEELLRLAESGEMTALRSELLAHLRMNVARFTAALSDPTPPTRMGPRRISTRRGERRSSRRK